MKQYTFWFECTDNGGGHQGFMVKAENCRRLSRKAWLLRRNMLRVISVGTGLAD